MRLHLNYATVPCIFIEIMLTCSRQTTKHYHSQLIILVGASDRSRVRLSELTLLMEDAWLSAHPQGDAGVRLSQFLATARFGIMQQVRSVPY